MRWPIMLRSTHEHEVRAWTENIRETTAAMGNYEASARELRAALADERRAHRKTLATLLRLKADGTLQPKRAAAQATPPAADPVGVAIEAVTAPYPRSERARLAAQQRDHAKRLAAQGFTPEQIAERLRAGSQERGD